MEAYAGAARRRVYSLRRYSFGLRLAIAQADARPAMPVSSDRTPPDPPMKRVDAPSVWPSPSDLDKKESDGRHSTQSVYPCPLYPRFTVQMGTTASLLSCLMLDMIYMYKIYILNSRPVNSHMAMTTTDVVYTFIRRIIVDVIQCWVVESPVSQQMASSQW